MVDAQTDSFNTSEFKRLTEDYLLSWQKLDFQPVFDAYVSGVVVYDSYEERVSNAFVLQEDIPLYVEPVGFTHTLITDDTGKTLYKVIIAANATVTTSNGTVIDSVNEFDDIIYGVNNEMLFHHKNTDIFLLLSLRNPFPEGDYTIKYSVKDVPSGKTFDLVKKIKVATDEHFCSMPENQLRADCKELLNSIKP